MKERAIDTKFIVIYAMLLICVVYAIFFLCGNLRGHQLYEKALNKHKPTIKSEKINYYRQVLSLLSSAISLNKGNAEYLAKKANFIIEAVKDEVGNSLNLDRSEAKILYEKAIELNPINFNYHSSLGEFYFGHDDKKAEEEFIKAARLYPSYYKVYSDLCRYYLSKGDQQHAFENLFLALYYFKDGSRMQVLDKIKSEVLKSNLFSLNEQRREITFTFSSPSAEFDFKKHGFPHVDIWLNIKVYIGKLPSQVRLYKENEVLEYFKLEKITENHQIYTLQLDPAKLKACLDELSIKVTPPLPLEKIEVIIVFTY